MTDKHYLVSPHKDDAPPARPESVKLHEAWMEREGLSFCHARGLRLLAPNGSEIRRLKYGDWQYPELHNSRWFDHVETFYHRQSKRYVMTSQPYDLTSESLEQLKAFCAQWHISVELTWDGWHYPSRCPLLIFRGDT